MDTKLNFLILVTLVGVGFYLFLVFREIKEFEHSITDLQVTVATLQQNQQSLQMNISQQSAAVAAQAAQAQVPSSCPSNQRRLPKGRNNTVKSLNNAEQQQQQQQQQKNDEIEEIILDNDSVDSAELKTILTKQQNDSDYDIVETGEVDETNSNVAIDVVGSETDEDSEDFVLQAQKNLKNMSEPELMQLKYEDLRYYLRKQGVYTKGTKHELISKILSL